MRKSANTGEGIVTESRNVPNSQDHDRVSDPVRPAAAFPGEHGSAQEAPELERDAEDGCGELPSEQAVGGVAAARSVSCLDHLTRINAAGARIGTPGEPANATPDEAEGATIRVYSPDGELDRIEVPGDPSSPVTFPLGSRLRGVRLGGMVRDKRRAVASHSHDVAPRGADEPADEHEHFADTEPAPRRAATPALYPSESGRR